MLLINSAINNRVLQYVFSRYFTYFIQLINSLFIAGYLGPYYLGIWGFINLIIQYFAQINFGISHSLNAILSINKDKSKYSNLVFNTSLALIIILSCLAILFFLGTSIFNINIGSVYNFSNYILPICIIVVSNYFISIFQNYFRVNNRLFEIAFSQSLFPILVILLIFFAKGEVLLNRLVFANVISFVISLSLFLWRCPIRIKPILPLSLVQLLIRRGFYLFVYNSSFYLIIISTRSFVSGFYSVKEFGLFTFSFTIANTILLLFESFSFLIFPKVLNRLGKASHQEAASLIEKLRNDYILVSHFLVHAAILLFPAFLYFFPAYSTAIKSLRLIALTLVLYTNCFGYSTLLIAKSKEKGLAIIAFSALCFNVILAFSFVKFLNVKFDWVILATTISYGIYLFFINFYGRSVINQEVTIVSLLKSAFPMRFLISFVVSLILVTFDVANSFYIIPFLLLFVLNFDKLKSISATIVGIVMRPNIIDV